MSEQKPKLWYVEGEARYINLFDAILIVIGIGVIISLIIFALLWRPFIGPFLSTGAAYKLICQITPDKQPCQLLIDGRDLGRIEQAFLEFPVEMRNLQTILHFDKAILDGTAFLRIEGPQRVAGGKRWQLEPEWVQLLISDAGFVLAKRESLIMKKQFILNCASGPGQLACAMGEGK